ncbi:hypothetical protein [uncultured Roseibium sp.]|uniref:hypothetical protein n=1 Tax=uncultured Roseibium sp. TaxID=1936171 RepID=UPI0026070D32|nr:hypothetical protein [uncultured Roseibium sp.]
MTFTRFTAATFAASILLTLSPSQSFGNPSERYLTEYKKYLDASCPLETDAIDHFVYFARDRDAIHNHALLETERLAGAQIMYSWRQLEPAEGRYDFSAIEADLVYLSSHGKKLFIQLQDASFSPDYKPVPEYLLHSHFDGGVSPQYTDSGELEGWVAKRWNPAVRARFAALLNALGDEFDGEIEGLNLQETSIGITERSDASFSPDLYVDGLKANMRALKTAFPSSKAMLYANFVPGEWLPWEDEGHLRGLYSYGEEIGVGLGAPDLMYKRKGQLNHALAMMHENTFTVPLGIAVQDGNYIGKTNDLEVMTNRKNIVPVLHAFAKHFLKVDYMFWRNQSPYFEQDLLGCLKM